jgi:hypothetical protein
MKKNQSRTLKKFIISDAKTPTRIWDTFSAIWCAFVVVFEHAFGIGVHFGFFRGVFAWWRKASLRMDGGKR